MKVVWNKVTRFSALIALAIFIALPFFAFWLGAELGVAKQYEADMLADLNSMPPPAPATRVIDYAPTKADEDKAIVSRPGSCFASSIAAPYRDDAWRCSVMNGIYDPCFETSEKTKVLCSLSRADDYFSSAAIINLTKPLPAPEGHLSPATPYDGAWLIKLKDGVQCAPFTGTLPFSDKGDVATYGCSDKRLIFGINADKKVWTAEVGSLGTAAEFSPPPLIDKATVPIAAVWK